MRHNRRSAIREANAQSNARTARSDSAGSDAAAVLPVITQQALLEYFELQELERRVQLLRALKKQELIRSLQWGASVEPGPNQVRLELRQLNHIDLADLQRFYPVEWVDELLKSIKSKPYQELIISPDGRN